MSNTSSALGNLGTPEGELWWLLQLSDSALPIGGFSFSLGLEGAVSAGMVSDAESLRGYLASLLHTVAHADGVALLLAHRAVLSGDWRCVCAADLRLLHSKSSHEARAMAVRMGSRLLELLCHLRPDSPLLGCFSALHRAGSTPSTTAVALAVGGAELGLDERQVVCSLLYSTASQLMGAALRLLRLDHLATQRILAECGARVAVLYDAIEGCVSVDDVCSFAPLLEVATSLHEQGRARLFMS